MIAMADLLEDCEAGYMGPRATLELFAELIRTGWAWELREPYPRTARRLIDAGYITPGGKITNEGRSSALDEGRESSPSDVERRVEARAFDGSIRGTAATPNA